MITMHAHHFKKLLITVLTIIVSMTSLSYGNDAEAQKAISEQIHERLDEYQRQGFLSAMNNSSMLLTFIFDADQLDSQRLAPIVAEFAKSSRFYLKSYAKDGKSLPAIKKAGTLNQAVIDQYFTGISMAYPLLVAMNHQGEQRILSQGVSDKTTIIARLSAFYQQTQLLDLDTRMAKAYWEDQVEEAMKKTTNNLAQ